MVYLCDSSPFSNLLEENSQTSIAGRHIDEHSLISVIMGVRCGDERIDQLRRAIRSILDQTYSNLELLICDDGSSPAVLDALDYLIQDEPRVRLVRKGTLLSLAPKLNACLKQAKGHWIARMDDDDISHPERLQKQMDFLQKNPKISFLGTYVNRMYGGSIAGIQRFPLQPVPRDFLFSMPFIHPSLIFRREALELVGGYDESNRCVLCEDYDLLLRLYCAGRVGANLPDPLLDYSVDGLYTRRRKYRHRINETRTRYRRFHELNLLPGAWPYVIKPLLVGLLPVGIASRLRDMKNEFGNRRYHRDG